MWTSCLYAIVTIMFLPLVHSQVCNNTCGEAFVYNNRCDEEGEQPLCLKGTDCADCQMTFPVWQIVISAVSVFILFGSVLALYCYREMPVAENDTESGKVQLRTTPPNANNKKTTRVAVVKEDAVKKGATAQKDKKVSRERETTGTKPSSNAKASLQQEQVIKSDKIVMKDKKKANLPKGA